MGKSIKPRVPSAKTPEIKTRKPRAQVRRNRDIGKQFEGEMFVYFTEYLRKMKIQGLVYQMPQCKYDQPIDIIIDSNTFGYIGCECKSVKNSLENDGKLYFSQIGQISLKNGLHQFINQHRFLHDGSRFGLMAFKFRDMKKVIIVPHQMVYEKLVNGELYITTEEIIVNGFDISDERASLKLFIRNKCKTVDE